MGTLEINASSSICRKCGVAYGRLKGNFPVSYSFLYKGSGYLPYCRTCIDEIYESYHSVCKDPKKAVRQVCRKLDIYWCSAIYDYVEMRSSSRSIMTAYIARANSTGYLGKSYDNTLIEEGTLWDIETAAIIKATESAAAKMDGEEEIYVAPEIIDFWGADYSPDFLLKLDKRYKTWTKGQDDLEPAAISLFKHICVLEETIAIDSAAGRPFDKNLNTLNGLLGSLNMKPVQKKDESDSAFDNTPFGVWIDRWEHKRPIPEPDPALIDVDGIVRYITVWFYGHISKTLGIQNVYCDMYEKEMEKMKVSRPESFDEELDDDETIFNSIFGTTEV